MAHQTHTLRAQLEGTGFRINPNDSLFDPSQTINFLGFCLDGTTESISHTPQRLRDLEATFATLPAHLPQRVYQRLAGHWNFYFSLYGGHFHALRPLHLAAATGIPPSPQWTALFQRIWHHLPHRLPWHIPEPTTTVASDASLTGLGVCLPQGNVAVVTQSPTGIYTRELTAVLLAAILAPPRSIILCDNEALVAAIIRGHGRTFSFELALAATLLFVNKALWIRWIPTTATQPTPLPA